MENNDYVKAILANIEFALVIDEGKQQVVLESHAHVNPQLKTKLIENKSWDLLNETINETCTKLQTALEVALNV